MLIYHSSNRRTITAAIKLAVILFILMAPVVLNSSGAQAANTDPDSTPTVSYVHINRNLIATGDMFLFAEVNIPYSTLPTATADQTFVFRLFDSTKSTEYGYNVPYVYFASGYNKNILALYFDAAHAPTWNTELYLRISENPSYFATPINTDIDVPTSVYTTLTAQADNQIELAQKLVPIFNDIGNLNSTPLLTSSGDYTVLNGTGELYARGAINGIQMMAPSLFLVQNLNIDYTNASWTTAQFDTYANRFNGTWVGDDMNATAAQFGMPPTMIMNFIVTLPLMLGAVVFTSIKFKHTDPGLMVCALLLLMSVQMGWLPKAIFATVYQACGIYVAYLWFYARG